MSERPKVGDTVRRKDTETLGRVVNVTGTPDLQLAWIEWEDARFAPVSVPVPVDHLIVVQAA